MTTTSINGLINNVALLLALALIYDVVVSRLPGQKPSLNQIPLGVTLGLVGIAIMMNPWEFRPGIIFDTRSVLLCVTGFFFGTVPALLSVVVTGGYRLSLGGAGAWTGVAVIVTSGAVGLVWRRWGKRDWEAVSTKDLYLMGLAAHVLMLLWMLTLPWSIAFGVLSKISLPVILIFPLATVLLGKLMAHRHERIRAVQAVQESEERFRRLFERSSNAIFLVDTRTGRYLDANRAGLRLAGRSLEELKALSTADVTPEGAQERLRIVPTKEDTADLGEVTYLRPDGSRRTATLTSVYLDEGRVFGIAVDITAHKQAEMALKESEERFRSLHNASFGGIAIHAKGRILECNKGLSMVTGYAYTELIGMDGLSLISDDTRDQVIDNINAGYEKPYEATGVRKNGETYALRLEARNIPYKGINVRVVEFRDISESKRVQEEKEKLESQLRQAQKMEAVGRLAGGVAHDFNNMLGVILGHTELIMEQVGPGQPFYTGLVEIKKAGERSADLTRQLLAFARKQTVDPKVLDLNKTMVGMAKMLQRLIGEDIDLDWKPGVKLWPVKMDPSQVDQILANLCVNARDAITGVGKVAIETENAVLDEAYCNDHTGFVPGEYVLLGVSDNGCGMDAETLDNAFEPFFTTKGLGKGTGLGLAMVYGAVKQNQGFVNMYSEPGLGTIVKIYLPRHLAAKAHLPAKGPGQPAERGCETILLVEDEPAILKMTTMMFQRLGYTVMAASSPNKAISFAREYTGKINLLVTDVVMPKMNGQDLASSILSIHPNLKCLFMSGYTANVITDNGVLDESVNFIHKPFSINGLATKVREALGRD